MAHTQVVWKGKRIFKTVFPSSDIFVYVSSINYDARFDQKKEFV
jgi:hypothetical protein